MLASGYQWSADSKSIVFTIRSGVEWSDGKDFTAEDVAFTFNLMKKTPSTDLFALWTGAGLTSATAAGDKVTLAFKQPAKIYFYNFAASVGIVPQHIWSTGAAAAHPDTYPDAKPIGTGPMLMNTCGPNNIEYVANPTFWQPDKPYIQKIEYPAYLDNGPANNDLASGKAQWGSQFIPNIKSFYIAKSKNNHTWSPPVLNVGLFPNLDPSHKATSTLAVRQAISQAIDRDKISKIGEGGQQPPANQTGVVSPTFDKFLDKAALAASGLDQPNADKGQAAAGHRRVLAGQPAQADRHLDHRVHRLGRLAGRHQAAASPRSASRSPSATWPSRPSSASSTPATTTWPTTPSRTAARRRTTRCAS